MPDMSNKPIESGNNLIGFITFSLGEGWVYDGDEGERGMVRLICTSSGRPRNSGQIVWSNS
jgi:hypothetical protein